MAAGTASTLSTQARDAHLAGHSISEVADAVTATLSTSTSGVEASLAALLAALQPQANSHALAQSFTLAVCQTLRQHAGAANLAASTLLDALPTDPSTS